MLHLGRGRTTDPVPRFSRCYFNYVCRVSVRHCHCPIIPSPVCPHFSCLVEGNFGLSILVSTIGKRNVSPRYVSMGKGEGEQETSRSTDFAFSPREQIASSRAVSPFPSYILHLFFETSSRRRPPPPSFPPHSIFVDASRCLAEILRFPPRYFREAVRKNGGGEEGRSGLLLWRHGCSAGYFLSCGKRRMRRTRTNRRIVLWPSADLSSSTTSTLPFLPPQSSLAHDRLVSTPRSSIPTVFSARLDPANRTDLCGFNPENPLKIVAGDKSAALPLTRPVLRIFVSRTSLSSSFPSLSFLYSICFFENVFLVFVFLDLSGHCPTRI